jgi:hypothetical protein
MKSRLVISGNDIDFLSELPISQNMSVNDVRNVGAVNGTYTNTISIPASPEVNRLFEFIFQVNAATNNFNPNLKTECQYFVNDVRVFNGYIQLLSISGTIVDQENSITYDCSLLGDNGNIFMAIAGKYLTDIDFSDLDHTLTLSTTNPLADTKFSPSVAGTGYVYPYIDYGDNDFQVGQPIQGFLRFEHLKPAIFEKEYLTRIFADAGYTWTNSSYPNTFDGTRAIIPCVKAGRLQIPAATKAAQSFRAGLTADQTLLTNGTLISGTTYSFHSATVFNPLVFNDDSTTGFFDNPSTFNTSNGRFVIPINAYYEASTIVNFKITVTPPSGTTIYGGTYDLEVELQKSTNSGSTWSAVNSSLVSIAIQGTIAADFNGGAQVSISEDLRTATTDIYRVVLKNQFSFINFVGGSGTCNVNLTVFGGTGTNASTFFAYINRADLPYGGTVEMNDTIPQNITQLDFLTSVIKLEHLILEIDKDDDTVYNIFPREEFYDETDVIDWTDKIAIDRGIKILPVGDLNFKRLTFTYRQDYDYYNQLYFDTFKEVYGTKVHDVENDFNRDEKKIEVVFSPTPIANWNGNGLIMPRFWKFDRDASGNNVVKPTQVNIRRLYFGGVLTTNNVINILVINGTYVPLNGYPYAGDVGNPYVPVTDYNFGTPRVLYWKYAASQYTTNSRFNERYSKWVAEITSPDSKVVKLYARLTENDIYKFSFRKIVFIIDAYYYVNAINGYDPQSESLCELELLKLSKGEVFVPSTIDIEADVVGNTGASNRVMNSSVGVGNVNNGYASFITGQNNVIGYGAQDINLIKCSNVAVNPSVTDFIGIGLEDVEIDSSMSETFKSGLLLDSQVKNRVITVSGNTTVTTDYHTYAIDAGGGDVVLTITDIGEKITVIRIDGSANAVTIEDAAALNINGSASKSLTSQYEKIILDKIGTEWIY